MLKAKAVRDYVRTRKPDLRIARSFIERLNEQTCHKIDQAIHRNGSHKTITSDCLIQVPPSPRRR